MFQPYFNVGPTFSCYLGYSTDRSKALVPVLGLLFVALWFILRGDLFYVLHCVILLMCFSVLFSIAITSLREEGAAITSLREERANLSAFRTFIRFVLVWFCWFPFPLGVWEGLRFLIVALPGLLSFLAIFAIHHYMNLGTKQRFRSTCSSTQSEPS